MAVQHNKPHDRRGTDSKIDGPYLTDIRAEQEAAAKEARAKARKATAKKVAAKKTAKKAAGKKSK